MPQDFQDRLHEAFLNRGNHRVLGYRLQPLSLWHCFMLDVAGNPALTLRGLCGFPELEEAAWICSQSYGPLGPVPRRGFRGFARRYLGLRHLDFERQRWQAYVADYFSLPRVWTGAGKPAKTPPVLYIVAKLISQGGFSHREAWTLPIGEAYWYAVALGEVTTGHSNLVSQDDYEALVEAGTWDDND